MMARASRSCQIANVELITIKDDNSPQRRVMPQSVEELQRVRVAAAAGFRPNGAVDNLNKTERAYLAYLETLGDLWFGVQCWTFILAHDCRYTPDFLALDTNGLRAIDTKATIWKKGDPKPLFKEDSQIKMRMAARLYPFVRWVAAFRAGDVWHHQEFKP